LPTLPKDPQQNDHWIHVHEEENLSVRTVQKSPVLALRPWAEKSEE